MTEPPTKHELFALRGLDPDRLYIG
jgi:hypothetical protein